MKRILVILFIVVVLFSLFFFERVRACIYICTYCVFFCQSAFAFRSASSRIQLMKRLTVVVSAVVVLSSPLWRYLFAFFYLFETSIHIFAVGSNQMEL